MGMTIDPISPAEAAQNRGPETIIVIGVLAVIAALFTALRLIARRISKTPLWIDDYLILLALVFCVTLVGLAIRAVTSGTGQHIQVLSPNSAINALKITFASQFLYTWCLASVKLSLLGQLWRIFSVMDRFRVSAYILTTLVLLWTVGTTITGLLECRPIHLFWTDPGSEHCISAERYLFANAIPNIATTTCLMLVPIPFVWKLPIKSWQRAGVIITFALGCLTVVVSIYRVTVVYDHKSNPDITWSFTDIIIWSAVEYSVGIVCANIPALAPLIRSLLRRFYYSKRVSSVRKSVVQRFSTPPQDATRQKGVWMMQPSPVAESTTRLNRCYSVPDEVVIYGEGHVLGGSEYVRGPRRDDQYDVEDVVVTYAQRDIEKGWSAQSSVYSTPVLTNGFQRL